MSVKTAVQKAGDTIAETATKVGHRVGETVEQAADWAKEKLNQTGNRLDETAQKMNNASRRGAADISDIQPKMEVVCSCGTRIGKVDHLDGPSSIKLMRNDPDSGGQHHWIPTSWVESVDDKVVLNVNSDDAMKQWKTSAA